MWREHRKQTENKFKSKLFRRDFIRLLFPWAAVYVYRYPVVLWGMMGRGCGGYEGGGGG